jgi:serine/threonine-protein kinase
MAQLMYRIANEHAPDILQHNPSLPPAFVAFLDKAMSKEAEQRYQTGEEFAAALRSTLGSTGAAAAAGGGAVDISL